MYWQATHLPMDHRCLGQGISLKYDQNHHWAAKWQQQDWLR